MLNNTDYTEDNIKSLDWKQHIRMRPGMYIGKLGDGSSFDDGIYVLLKEIIDNSIDEFVMGGGNRIDISIEGDKVSVRDYGRGIPLGKVAECVSQINTGGKYDSRAFTKSVGLNGVGTKAVNALSSYFKVESFRENEVKAVEFSEGKIVLDKDVEPSDTKNGTNIVFVPDTAIFGNYTFREDYVEKMINNYSYLNTSLTISYNGKEFSSDNGLKDLLTDVLDEGEYLYPIIHLKGDDIEIAMTHSSKQYNEDYYSFVNGQNTLQGGTHQSAFKEAVFRTIRDFYGKNYDSSDVRKSIVSAISIKVIEPVFESQTKTKLGSTEMGADLPTIRSYVNDFISKHLNDFLHKNSEVASILQNKIIQSEKERKELAGIRKIARERAKTIGLHNKKLRDCRQHYNKGNSPSRLDTTIFITEGNSASGSITKSRNVETQAVFTLKGKPLNSYGLTKKVVYENEEFNFLQAALNIENGMEDLRYNNVVIATDADVDGMHIRLLLITFFLQFFPELIKERHLYILETPLFRVRDKKSTSYCYSEKEKQKCIKKMRADAEITRFKGLGEISPDEFKHFIGKNIRLEPVIIDKQYSIDKMLDFYMGKNTNDRQSFIIDNLKIEKDLVV
ncbi:DNA topoisomerase IV subunit B [Ichthyobacterium seriolicida]|uniref:DNA topoisomerase (ATP-hydrolyzing) n=1 Tax=Ichthyobacterium seriolicida TaxID=242600 RepID=A0A1J1E916_9FLAO|nr:DNA topoisomerase IV subunit B [Ichthyobacterium seriolicida]BAV94411.1 topoisomerase IV subunit B [Ichthyobacterium seriolicida]